MARRRLLLLVFAGAVWVTAAIVGLVVLTKHEAAAGDPGRAPTSWPGASPLAAAHDRATLVLLVHPECVCSNASITELERLMARESDRLAAHALVVAPRGFRDDPRRSAKWARLSRIPGVTVTLDPGGALARTFGASTSGQVVVYDADGSLAFQGGITVSRGHEGDNDGVAAIDAFLAQHAPSPTTPVYGCALAEPTDVP